MAFLYRNGFLGVAFVLICFHVTAPQNQFMLFVKHAGADGGGHPWPEAIDRGFPVPWLQAGFQRSVKTSDVAACLSPIWGMLLCTSNDLELIPQKVTVWGQSTGCSPPKPQAPCRPQFCHLLRLPEG